MIWRTAMYAVKKGNKEIVERLLQKGADVNLRDKFGITALMRAVSSNHKEIIERLLQKGADVNVKNNDGETPLMRAVKNGNKDIVELLIKNSADVNAKNDDGKTALIRAVEKGNKDIVELLIQKGADVNLGDRYRGAPLCHATLNGEEKIVDLLFQNGADLNKIEWKFKDVLIFLEESKYYKMIHSFVAAALRKSSRFPIPDIDEGSRFMFSEHRKTDYLDAVRVGSLGATKERLVKVLIKTGRIYGKTPPFRFTCEDVLKYKPFPK